MHLFEKQLYVVVFYEVYSFFAKDCISRYLDYGSGYNHIESTLQIQKTATI